MSRKMCIIMPVESVTTPRHKNIIPYFLIIFQFLSPLFFKSTFLQELLCYTKKESVWKDCYHIMVFLLIWVLRAVLFVVFFYFERRRLFNAYLLSIVLILFSAIVSGLFVIHMEQLVNRNLAMLSLLILALFIPLSVIISTIYSCETEQLHFSFMSPKIKKHELVQIS